MGNIQWESGFNVNSVNGDDGGIHLLDYFNSIVRLMVKIHKMLKNFFKIIGGHEVKGQINFLTRKK